jgi:lipopolysaccharide biosynthesis regulator YciM
MSYLCYAKQGKDKEAREYLKKIKAFNPKLDNTVKNFLPANHLVTTWAMEKLDGKASAANWLNGQLKQYPNDGILKWCKLVFENKPSAKSDINDSGARILEQLRRIK